MYRFFVEGGLMLSIVVILLLLFFSKKNNAGNFLLGVTFFCIAYTLFVNNLHVTQAIVDHPYLIRTANITGYLILPFLYFYSRRTFYPGDPFKLADLLFLAPAALYVADMLPFFFSDPGYKISITKANLKNPARMFQIAEGWIGIRGFHFIFRYLVALTVMIFQVKLLIRNRKLWSTEQDPKNRSMYFFIVTVTALLVPLIIPGIFGVLFHFDWYSLRFLNVNFSIVLLAASLFILFSPSILYGFLPKPNYISPFVSDPELISFDTKDKNGTKTVEKETISASRLFINPEELQEIIHKIEMLMDQRKPYLDKQYSIHDLARDVTVPVYQLSPIINQYFKVNFNTWLNRHRINYFLSLYDLEGKKEITLEALAAEAGFFNRTTFINAFKKEKGDTPGIFLKKRHNMS